MAKILLFPRNVLVLDEPTNHLDIPARETLEAALEEYEGTLIVVSHDRYFLDRVCTRLVVIEGKGVEAHVGNYTDWRAKRREREGASAARHTTTTATTSTSTSTTSTSTSTSTKRESQAAVARAVSKDREREVRRLVRRVETLEEDVGKIETELAAVRAELAGDHAGDWQKLHQLADRERELDALLARRMTEWETASAALAEARDLPQAVPGPSD
jgi:ATP-binding cassette subfamily F protein 3